MSEKTISLEWIPGDTPEKKGLCEVTLITGDVDVYFFNGTHWDLIDPEEFKTVIAYKPFKLSDPYVCPERELFCLFCNSGNCSFSGTITTYQTFRCKACSCKIEGKRKKEILDLYDKLKGGY